MKEPVAGVGPVVWLDNGPMRCGIAPELGGAILALTCRGIPALRGFHGKADVLAAACYPLVPFANRIAFGRFGFGGRQVALAIDPAGAPHALHGHGWRQAWSIEQREEHRLTLAMDHPADDWPWSYRAWQRFELLPDGLAVELSIENRDRDSAMPAGLGLHPFFVRRKTSRITATATAVWANGPNGLADTLCADDRFSGQAIPVAKLAGLDNFFLFPDPTIIMADDTATVTLSADGAGFHLYCPPGEPYFCVEPVSHAPNSFGRGELHDGDIVAPLARITQGYRFTIRTI